MRARAPGAHAYLRVRCAGNSDVRACICATSTDTHLSAWPAHVGAAVCWLQHVPYVKTMFSAVIALKGACREAVHNKERCTALGECVRSSSDFVHESGGRMLRVRTVGRAGGSKGSARCSTGSSTRTTREVRCTLM